ncbi:MAG: hypothetical protein WAL72_30215 [Streptosporangiaceae bacterium]
MAVAVTVAVAADVAAAVAVTVVVTPGLAVVVTPGLAVLVTPGLAVLVTPGVAVAVVVLLGKLLSALWAVLPHPAARHPATRTAAGRQSPLVVHRMSVLPPRSRSAAGDYQQEAPGPASRA